MVLTEPIAVGTEIEGVIERVAHGGEGVTHVGGLVVFVPWTAPGDRVRGEVVERRPRWARARPVEVVDAATDRVPAGCPVFATCGGCQLQHLEPDLQRAIKAQVVVDALAHIGGIDRDEPIECRPAAPPWHYRRRATFTWRWDGERLWMGFRAARLPLGGIAPRDIVDIHACPILAEEGNTRLAGLREGLAAGLRGSVPIEGRLGLRALAPGLVDGGIFAPDERLAERLAGACAERARIATTWGQASSDGPPALGVGAPRLQIGIVVRGSQVRIGFDSFVQADLRAAEELYDAVFDELQPVSGQRVIDGYAGIGIVACELARRGLHVTAVESHPGAAADLRANAAAVEGAGVHVLELPAERVDWTRPRPDTILLNPPRAGCAARVLESVTRSSARRLVYVSCEPATLARDVRRLGQAWRLEGVRAFDLFPQTAHVEIVARLERR